LQRTQAPRWRLRILARCSMSRVGDCCDNAVAESFFASLKKELPHRCAFQTPCGAMLRLRRTMINSPGCPIVLRLPAASLSVRLKLAAGLPLIFRIIKPRQSMAG
jgi:transposase InsO family protein